MKMYVHEYEPQVRCVLTVGLGAENSADVGRGNIENLLQIILEI